MLHKFLFICGLLATLLVSLSFGCDEGAHVSPDESVAADGGESMPASLRAAVLRARQENAGPEFFAAFHGEVPTFTNGRQRGAGEAGAGLFTHWPAR